MIRHLVNLDWHMRLASMLSGLPIDRWCKPHPEGEIDDLPHPLEAVAQVSYEPFEAPLTNTDVFVFDLMSSTTFWKALCTDPPVVYIDMGINGFSDWIEPSIAARCRVVPARHDERNLPFVDADEVATAVCEAPQRSDDAPIRRPMGVAA